MAMLKASATPHTALVVYICWSVTLAVIPILLFPVMLLWDRTDLGSELNRMGRYGFPHLAREFPVLTELAGLALAGIVMPRLCFKFGYPAPVSAALYAMLAYGYLLQPAQATSESAAILDGIAQTVSATKVSAGGLRRPPANATLIGLVIALTLPITPVRQPFLYLLVTYARVSWITAWEGSGAIINTAAVLAIIFIVTQWERRPAESIGWRTPRLQDVVLGIAAFVAMQQVTLISWELALKAMPGVVADTLAVAVLSKSLPVGVSLVASVCSAIAEEVAFRGYALERLSEITGSKWVGAALPYLIEVLFHAPIWGIHGMLLKAPPLAILVLLYLWRRSLPANVIGHLLADIIPVFW